MLIYSFNYWDISYETFHFLVVLYLNLANFYKMWYVEVEFKNTNRLRLMFLT